MISPQLIATAISIIDTFGSTINLVTETNSYNTSTGQIEASFVSSDPLKAHIESYESKEIQGLILAGDIKITLANDNLTIDNNVKVLFNAVTYNIINIEPVYLEGNVVIYNLQVRK